MEKTKTSICDYEQGILSFGRSRKQFNSQMCDIAIQWERSSGGKHFGGWPFYKGKVAERCIEIHATRRKKNSVLSQQKKRAKRTMMQIELIYLKT